ncbi:MAG: hypothetical protein QM621_00395 [Aeromicrobium sp.]
MTLRVHRLMWLLTALFLGVGALVVVTMLTRDGLTEIGAWLALAVCAVGAWYYGSPRLRSAELDAAEPFLRDAWPGDWESADG